MSSTRTWVAELHEAEAVAQLMLAFRDHLGAPRPSDNAMLAAIERLMENSETEYLLCAPHDDAPPAGVAQLRFRLSVWTSAADCWLEDLFVREDVRGQGLGAALMELAITRARARGCRRIELDTAEENRSALALYERCGFSTHSKGSTGRDLFLGRRLDD